MIYPHIVSYNCAPLWLPDAYHGAPLLFLLLLRLSESICAVSVLTPSHKWVSRTPHKSSECYGAEVFTNLPEKFGQSGPNPATGKKWQVMTLSVRVRPPASYPQNFCMIVGWEDRWLFCGKYGSTVNQKSLIHVRTLFSIWMIYNRQPLTSHKTQIIDESQRNKMKFYYDHYYATDRRFVPR